MSKGARYCCYCGRSITGTAQRIDMSASMSGAREDLYAHPGCGPRTRSISHAAPRLRGR
ncbi:hypothetical protein [Streptomyces sp. PR69]|uniref:hypothetical protein n=1 Tax=Streptomyces sp. PR69 TaxID=2984950 RepID=UPI002264010D|nr:hypothetical protein [Streptomyces sp. PR69]